MAGSRTLDAAGWGALKPEGGRGIFRLVMPPGFPPADPNSSARNQTSGPSENLSLGTTGLVTLPEVTTALTFLPPTLALDPDVLRGAWEAWVARCFAPLIAPALVEMANFASREQVRDLRVADRALADRLDPATQARLGAAGRNLMADLNGARAARWLERFQTWAATGETPGLFTTVFAARAALFHLPLRPMLTGYARMEWCAAVGSGKTAPTDAVDALPVGLWRPAITAVAA